MDFLEALGHTLQQIQPDIQRYSMYRDGIDPRIVEPQIQGMRDDLQRQRMVEREKQRKQSIAQRIVERAAELTPQEIMAIGAEDMELGKLAANVYKQSQEQRQAAQLQEYLGGGNLDADSLAKAGIATGNPQLMQYAQMLDSRKKLTKDQWGNPVVMDISTPNGGMTTPPIIQQPQGGGSRTPDYIDTGDGISMQELPPETGGGNMPPAGGDMPEIQALDEMANLGMPNTPQGWAAYTKYKENQRASNKENREKQAKFDDLRRMESKLPELFDNVQNLSAIGKEATYTRLGYLKDEALKELGFGATEGSVAANKYNAAVKNQVFPLLRETFGAQFTVKEGESLLETLGTGYKSPEEKNAILQAFIDQKVASVNSERRRVGLPEVEISPPQIEGAASVSSPAKQKIRVFNPATGRLE